MNVNRSVTIAFMWTFWLFATPMANAQSTKEQRGDQPAKKEEPLPKGAKARLEGAAKAIAISSDGKLAAAVGSRIHLWDTATWKKLPSIDFETETLAFAPKESKTLAAGRPNHIYFLDVSNGKTLRKSELDFSPKGRNNKGGNRFVFSPDGKHMAISVENGDFVEIIESEIGRAHV